MQSNKKIMGLGFVLSVLFVQVLLAGGEPDSRVHYWVYFQDKDGVTPANFDAGEYEFPQLTQRCLDRRAQRGVIDGPCYLDLDVSSTYIESMLQEGMEVRFISRWLNAVSVSADPDQMEDMEARPEIRKISRVRKVTKKLVKKISREAEDDLQSDTDYGAGYRQLQQINAIAAHDSGYSGNGVWLLMLDTGFMTEHEVFQADRIMAEWDFVQGDSITHNQEGDHPAQHDHGTHTASVAGGYAEGSLVGVAYDCDFLLAKTEILDQEIQVEEDQYVAGLEWGEALGADVANSSLGYSDWYSYEDMDGDTPTTSRCVDLAVSMGLVCVTSMGNEGNSSWYYMIAPADADSVIAVGAVDSLGTIANFSSHGPTYDGRLKPEVVAQGVYTYAAGTDANDDYLYASGTSLSAPLVAGAAALVLEAHPDWTPMMVREAMMMTADQPNAPDNSYGFGILDVVAAIEYDPAAIPGDITGDNLLNISDAILAIEWLVNQTELSDAELDLVDVSGDGIFNVSDIVVLIEWMMAL